WARRRRACSLRWRTRPAGACSPSSPSAARGPRRRWPVSCRSAAWRSSSISRSSSAPGSSRAGAQAARSGSPSARSRSATRLAGWRASPTSGTPAWRPSSGSPKRTRPPTRRRSRD
ncbi:MAG: hypothetical protein AVDCRST_MAG13-3922, partial [uncultured Solirubrobacteraceae bacterium]